MSPSSKKNVGGADTGTPEVLPTARTAKRSTRTGKRVAKRSSAKPRLAPIKLLRKKAWDIWSQHIRKSSADWRGYARCYTCGQVKMWKELQAGHFLHGVLDFDERNIHPQCQRCNHYKSGNLAPYATKLVKQYGPMILKELEIASGHKGNNYDRQELEYIIQTYRE